jgi:hypothetical protein
MALTPTNAVNEIAEALGNRASRVVIDKASISNAAVGHIFSLWRATGIPSQGAIPAAAAICTSALTGCIGFANQTAPITSYYAYQTLTTGNAATSVEIHDRLAHVAGLSGIVTTAQGALTLAGLSAARLGDTNYSDVLWWLEWYADTGATAATATVNVTYNDDTTGNLTAVSLGTTVRASRMFPLRSAVGGKWIKAVNSVTLSATTGTAGNFGITATRWRTTVSANIANKAEHYDWALLGIPEIPNDSCLQMLMVCTATGTGTLRGTGKIIHV